MEFTSGPDRSGVDLEQDKERRIPKHLKEKNYDEYMKNFEEQKRKNRKLPKDVENQINERIRKLRNENKH